MKVKTFVDGDQLVVVGDDFVNLQESPAMFVPLTDVVAAMAEAELVVYTAVAIWPDGEQREIIVESFWVENESKAREEISALWQQLTEKNLRLDMSILPVIHLPKIRNNNNGNDQAA